MIVHSSIDENGNAHGGKVGDQTGREVYTRSWYSKPWGLMIRWTKDPSIGKKAVEIAIKLANSNLVGYDQYERNTLYKALKAVNWDVDAYIKSGKKTESDCSSFVYACYACLLPSIRSDATAPRTGTMRADYKKFGFTIYTESKYLTGESYLLPGDILVKENSHTVMETATGSKATVSTPTPSPTPSPTPTTPTVKVEYAKSKEAGKSKGVKLTVTASSLNVRSGAGTNKPVINVLAKGAVVKWYGYYTAVDGTPWYLIIDSTGSSGFVSSKYVK